MKHATEPLFRSAVTGDDGHVDAGYLALFYGMVVVTASIPVMVLGALIQLFTAPEHRFPVQELGIGIGSVCGGFGAFAAAIGAFRMGDKPHANTMTTSATTRKTVVTAPAVDKDPS